MERNKRRSTMYKRLRECGFSCKDATKYKDYKPESVELFCKFKQEELSAKTELDRTTSQRMLDVIQRVK